MSSPQGQPPADIDDIETLAMANLSPAVQAYIQAATGRGLTARENRQAFDRWRLLPKVLSGAPRRSAETTLLGRPVSMPVGVAPTAAHCIVHPDAELAVARAASAARTVMAVSVMHSVPLQEVATAAGPDAVLWAQLDIRRKRSLTLDDALLAERCGFAALVVTLDAPLVGRKAAPGVTDPVSKAFAETFRRLRGGTPDHQWDPCQSWADIEWLRGAVHLPLVLKGILRADDASEAVKRGVSGIVVSNHGGRYMDGVPATLDALPGVVEAVANRCEVYVDGGVRSGADVVKALALGARAVFLGRPVLYGLGVNKESPMCSSSSAGSLTTAWC
ncbi:2-Hydroxyacid oxidase 1-like isoform X2 [Amblyomma americanum]